MSNEELSGFLAQGLQEAECYEVDCGRCGIVRLIAADRPDVCPICGVKREVWQRRAIVLTRQQLPQFAVVRRPISRLLSGLARASDETAYNRAYAAGLEGRYTRHTA